MFMPERKWKSGRAESGRRTAEAMPEVVPAKARPYADAATAEAMATLGLANDPATVSLL